MANKENGGSIFSPESGMMRFLNRLGDMIILSLIFVIFSIPIITIGANLSAVSYTAVRAVSGDDGYIFKRYWKSFRKNFKQATLAWLIMFVIGSVLGFDVYFWIQYRKVNPGNTMFDILLFISVIMLAVYAMYFIYIFPLIGNYETKLKQQFSNAILVAIHELPWTGLLILLYGVTGFLVWGNIPFIFLFGFIGFGGVSLLAGLIYKKVFNKVMSESDTAKQEVQVEREERKKQIEEVKKEMKKAQEQRCNNGRDRSKAFHYVNPANEDEDYKAELAKEKESKENNSKKDAKK